MIRLPVLRIYLRRSKADPGKQEFSLDVQREGCKRFAEVMLPNDGIDVSWEERVEYIDDDRAGDDFAGRSALPKLLEEVQAEDVIVCRDQSRIGRDALEVTSTVRTLVRSKKAWLFYYVNGRRVEMATAMDAAMTFIQGTGHQIELEGIRSRTKEALREKVRAGRIAGGRCYGYTNLRQHDSTGRTYVVAEISEQEAEIVRRVFREYAGGSGLKRIASSLNDDRVPAPRAGQRGSGSWSTSMIRAMLRNDRYRGIYIYGRVKRIRSGSKRLARTANEGEILRVEISEWKIIDDILFAKVKEHIAERAFTATRFGPAARYALSGVGRCACGGAIGVANTKRDRMHVKAYACSWHHTRGRTVCPVTVRQPVEDVESALADYLQAHALTPAVVERLLAEVRRQVERRLAADRPNTGVLETELHRLRREQKNLAEAVALGGQDVRELVQAMRHRAEHAQRLEAQLTLAKHTPRMTEDIIAKVENAVREKLADLRTALARDSAGAREVYMALFPDGLLFTPAPDVSPKVWKIQGVARLDNGFKLNSDPTGI